MDPLDVQVRPATDDDREFSYQVKKAAERVYIEANWGWDEDVQKAWHARDGQEMRPDVVLYEGRRIGTIYAREEDGVFHIRQFFILPEFQNRGIGSELMRRALARADSAGLVTRLEFVVGNRVESLYRRFGFREISGDRDKYRFMERPPQG